MKLMGKVSKRTLMKMGPAMLAAGTLLGASRNAQADEQDLLATLADQRRDLLKTLTTLRPTLPTDVVYVQSNITTEGGNSILGFRRGGDGSLTPLPESPYPTRGEGFFVPTLAVGPAQADQQIVLDRLRGVLYAVNGGSNTVAAMRIATDGSLEHLPGSPFQAGGTNPSSLGLRLDSLVVTDADSIAAALIGPHPSVSLFGIDQAGGLHDIASTFIALPAGSTPSQPLTTDTGPFTFICSVGSGSIGSYLTVALGAYGLVSPIDQQTPPQQAGAASVPVALGLAAHPTAQVLYVGFATTEQLGVYRWDDFGRLSFLRTATNSGQAICWLRLDKQGRRLYTVNAADSSISVYDTSAPEQPVEIQHLVLTQASGIATQFELSPDGTVLYVLEIGESRPDFVAGVLQVFPSQLRVFAIDQASGTITEVLSARLTLDLPGNTIPQGVATL